MSSSLLHLWQRWPQQARTLCHLFALISLALLPHLSYLPIWIPVVFLLSCAWRLHIELAAKALPARWLRNTLAVLLLLPLMISMGGFNGYEAGAALLTLMAGMKLLEARQTRDHLALIFVVLFLLFAALLYQQQLLMLPYLLVCTALSLALLMRLTLLPNEPSVRDALWRSTRIILQALPLVAVTFVLLPRLPGQLWALPSHAMATTGLSDHMNPGDVAELKQSTAVAFRVRFSDAPPAQHQRYWRAIVLNDFDGRTWRQQRMAFTTRSTHEPARVITYRMLLEPSNQSFVPALDIPIQADLPHSFITSDRQLVTATPLNQLTSLTISSALDYQLGVWLSSAERRQSTRLPDGFNPRALALAKAWREQSRDDQAYVTRLLNWFHDAPFYYTLTPPLLGRHSIDEFLFTTQRGFCEHYASAMTVMLRAAGMPARVVTGYQGGEFNPVSGYWVMRQSDAHAWVEVWLPNKGWMRIDPTAAIAPERVEQGLVLPEINETSVDPHLIEAGSWLADAQQRWDAVNTFWKERIVEFDKRKQEKLLEKLGIHADDWRTLGMILTATFAAFFVALTGWLAWQQRAARKPVELQLWQQFIQKLARLGIHHQSHEGPHDFATRATQQRPELKAAIESFTRAYLALRYGPAPSQQLIRDMKQKLQRLPRR